MDGEEEDEDVGGICVDEKTCQSLLVRRMELNMAHYTLDITHYIMHNAKLTPHNIHFYLYTAQYTLHTLHSTL